MARFSRRPLLVLGTVGLLALASCSTPATNTISSAGSASSTTSPASPIAQTKITNLGFDGLLKVVSNTRQAVEAEKFDQAQAEFDRFEEFWSQVEDGVKAQSDTTYNAIEDAMDQVSNGLKASQPDKAKLLATLAALQAHIVAAE